MPFEFLEKKEKKKKKKKKKTRWDKKRSGKGESLVKKKVI